MIHFDSDTLTHFSYGNANVCRKIEESGDEPLKGYAIHLVAHAARLAGIGDFHMNRRLRVIVPCLILGLIWSLSCFGSTPFPLGLALGPFAMLVGISSEAPYYSERGMCIEAVVLMALIVCHPIKPNVATGLLSGIGLFLWFFTGLVYMSDGC